MINTDQINYVTVRDHAAKGVSFKCTASLAKESPAGAVPEVVSAVGVAENKDAARDAAQLAILAKLVGAHVKAAPPPPAKPKE